MAACDDERDQQRLGGLKELRKSRLRFRRAFAPRLAADRRNVDELHERFELSAPACSKARQ